jgi:hypothetical protein
LQRQKDGDRLNCKAGRTVEEAVRTAAGSKNCGRQNSGAGRKDGGRQ